MLSPGAAAGPTEPELPAFRPRQHLHRTRSIPARFRDFAVYSAPEVPIVPALEHETQNQTLSPGPGRISLFLNFRLPTPTLRFPDPLVDPMATIRIGTGTFRMMSIRGQ